MTRERMTAILEKYPNLRVAVVGDFCLDRYLEIDPARAEGSIETRLPVHNVVNVRPQPGGAGTVLANLAALGIGTLRPVGWCGDDGEGYELRKALGQLPGVTLEHFTMTPLRRTFTYCKPLVVGAVPRELNRLDSKNWSPTPASLREQVIRSLAAVAESVDAIVLLEQVSEPGTGVFAADVLAEVAALAARKHELLMIADSRRGLADWPAVTLKMNASELKSLREQDTPRAAARALAQSRGCDVFVTLAELGLLAATRDGELHQVPARPVRGPIDVVGAGDAVTANLAAALAAGATVPESLDLAAAAASIVLHKLGTTGTASRAELLTG